MNILLVEDDEDLRVALGGNLEKSGYGVHAVRTAEAARAAMKAHVFELVILDVMLPGEDGYSLCRALRKDGVRVPVLMLTARSLEDDIVRGFEAGAQDYLTKPYRLRELLARVKALLARGGAPLETKLTLDGLAIDLESRRVSRGGAEIALTKTELDLLAYLLRHPDRALPRDEILDAVWGTGVVVDPRTVDNFVSSLKKKLGWTSRSSYVIHTVRGVGYRMELLP